MSAEHINNLFAAELQFRLASAVRLATASNIQPLDLPTGWTHGTHRVHYSEIALRPDQADFAACCLHKTATILMAVAVKDAIKSVVSEPWKSPNSDVAAAYQIARQIRNAFAHGPFAPRWVIDKELRGKIFRVPNVIEFDTTDLDGTAFDWRHYGGPLALFRLCRFVRFEILKDQRKPRQSIPIPKNVIYQQGDLILRQLDNVPERAVKVESARLSDGGILLGGGHVLYPTNNK